MIRETISAAPGAPAAIGPYAQAVRAGHTIYLSGQIGMNPQTMVLEPDVSSQARQVFTHLAAVAKAAGSCLADAVKVNLYLVDIADFDRVNAVMAEFFKPPYPARATVEVRNLPKGARIEADAVLCLAQD
jgi:reactive intermediate/imine deaminase